MAIGWPPVDSLKGGDVEGMDQGQIRELIREVVREELGQNDPAVRRLLGKPAAAEFLDTSVRGLDRLADKKLIPFVQVGGRRKFAVADLIEFQRRHTTAATA